MSSTLFRMEKLLEGKIVVSEHRLLRKDSNKVPVEISARILPDGRLQEIIRDITDRKLAEDEKQKLEEQLRRSQKLETIGTLAGGIAHDFNNILTPIMGFTEMSLINLKENDPMHYKLEQVLNAAFRASKLVEQILLFSKQSENEHFSLGIKHLTPDPWNEIPEKYKPGTRVSGKVTNITDFGLFVELEEGIEGLIHVSQLPKGQQGAKELKDFQVGDELEAEVVNVSQKDKRIGLSIRKLQESPEKKVYTNYVNNKEKATSNLGALLKEKMMDLDSDDPQNDVTSTVNE